MRSLQECQAEVFRRGERRIRQRKRRTIGILLACVPLCLCLALLPWGSGKKETKDRVVYSSLQENSLGGSGLSVSSVKVYGKKGSYTLTDTGDILYIMGFIEQYPKYSVMDDAGTDEPEAAPEQTETMDVDDAWYCYRYEESPVFYTFTLFRTDGSIRMYTVTENKIVGLQTDELVILTDAQAAELLSFLAAHG